MKKRIYLVIISVFIIGSISILAIKPSNSVKISNIDISNIDKNKLIESNFSDEYKIDYSIEKKKIDNEKDLIELTKKITYLLLGPANNLDEKSENYYKRTKDFFSYKYDPDLPKKEGSDEIDTNSKEFSESLGVDIFVGKTFQLFDDLKVIYSDFGNIEVSNINEFVITSIVLENVKLRDSKEDNPLEYDYINTNLVIHYVFKKYKNEYKLYYFYGDTKEEVEKYLEDVDDIYEGTKAIVSSYDSNLKDLYNFSKINSMSDEEINSIYDKNINNIFYLHTYYHNTMVASSTGVLINDGIVLTTWEYLEKSLREGQLISIRNKDKVYDIDGIIMASSTNNVALIKLKEKEISNIEIDSISSINIEDPAIIVSHKLTGDAIQKGIIVSKDDYIKTSIPVSDFDTGAPLFNKDGKLVGISTSMLTNSSISYAIPSNLLTVVRNKFNNIDFDSIRTVSFKELKEKYYYTKYGEEIIRKNIPSKIWDKYKKIGNIEDNIKLEIVKANYFDDTLTIRYKNNMINYIDNLSLANTYKEELINEGFKNILKSTNKEIYENNKYQIVLLSEFDYLIVVMVKK